MYRKERSIGGKAERLEEERKERERVEAARIEAEQAEAREKENEKAAMDLFDWGGESSRPGTADQAMVDAHKTAIDPIACIVRTCPRVLFE